MRLRMSLWMVRLWWHILMIRGFGLMAAVQNMRVWRRHYQVSNLRERSYLQVRARRRLAGGVLLIKRYKPMGGVCRLQLWRKAKPRNQRRGMKARAFMVDIYQRSKRKPRNKDKKRVQLAVFLRVAYPKMGKTLAWVLAGV